MWSRQRRVERCRACRPAPAVAGVAMAEMDAVVTEVNVGEAILLMAMASSPVAAAVMAVSSEVMVAMETPTPKAAALDEAVMAMAVEGTADAAV